MHTIEAEPLYMLVVFVATIFAFKIIDWIDGASRWEQRQKDDDKRREAEGWASIRGN